MLKKIFLFICFFVVFIEYATAQQSLKIGMVHLNRILNESVVGKRSKKLLEKQAQKSQVQLKAMQNEIEGLKSELENSLLINSEKKAQKQLELEDLEKQYEENSQKEIADFRESEQRYTANTYLEIKDVIEDIGKKERYDMVIERAARVMLLYTKYEIVDITDLVIEEYDKLQKVE